LTRFFLALFGTAAVLGGAAYLLLRLQYLVALPSFFLQSLILLIFGTTTLFVYLFRFNRSGYFVQIYLLTMGIKLVGYGAYNFFMIAEDEAGAASNVVWFMLVYVIFTALEIGFLYPKISK
jgi:hypothetical protein